jgi:hypothetical protein
LQASGVHREDRVQSQGRLDDSVRRAMELRVLCAQARADAAGLKVDAAEVLAAAAETRERALCAREEVRLRQSRRDTMRQAARELKGTRMQTALTCPGPPGLCPACAERKPAARQLSMHAHDQPARDARPDKDAGPGCP